MALQFAQKYSNLPAINSVGSLNLKYVQQSLIVSVLEVRNNFIKTRVTVKSSDLMSVLFNLYVVANSGE